MQATINTTLDVISVNVWAILASLANLLIIAWIVKRFLFKPVKKIVDARRSNEIVAEAREKATELRRQAEADAILERKKAEDDMKREIADLSAQLTGKLLQREINEEDHRALIDSFLQEIKTDDDNK